MKKGKAQLLSAIEKRRVQKLTLIMRKNKEKNLSKISAQNDNERQEAKKL